MANNGISIGSIGDIGTKTLDRAALLDELVNKVDRPILVQMGRDMLTVMGNWLEDPEVLCCIIHAIWGAYVTKHGSDKSRLSLGETEFNDFLDAFIALIDLIIILLTDDLKKIQLFFPDMIKEITNGILGALLLAVQEIVYSLRDSAINAVLEWANDKDAANIWRRCLPFKELLNLLKKYTHDYGLVAKLLDKIKGFTSGTKMEWLANADLPTNAKDLEFLFWLRDLLLKLKQSVMNFDFCVDYEYIPPVDDTDENAGGQNDDDNNEGDPSSSPNFTKVSNNSQHQGYTIGDDGNVIVDSNKIADDNGMWLSKVSNSFIREFIHKEYNLPYDAIDNTITRTTSGDTVQGTNVNSRSGNAVTDICAGTPTPRDTLKWILNIRDRIS